MAKQKVTIQDVAAAAGVGIATVSNVLNNRGGYSEATAKRVLEQAHRLGYVMNLAAKTLRESRSHAIGIITPNVGNDFFSTLVLRAEMELYDKGYSSYICNTAHDAEREDTYVDSLMARRVDGLVFVGGHYNLANTAALDIPVVSIAADLRELSRNSATINNDINQIFSDAILHLARKGCRNTVVIASRLAPVGDIRSFYQNLFAPAFQRAGLTLTDASLLLRTPDMPNHLEAKRLLDEAFRHQDIDGVFAIDDYSAAGAVASCIGNDLMPGRDVLILGMDDSMRMQATTPSVSSINRHPEALVDDAIETFLTMLETGKPPSQKEITVPYDIIDRDTTAGPLSHRFPERA